MSQSVVVAGIAEFFLESGQVRSFAGLVAPSVDCPPLGAFSLRASE
jgi:hypothetical protein